MAKGKIKSIGDSLNIFIDIKTRCKLDKLISINDMLMGVNDKDVTVLFQVDRTLLSHIHENMKDDIIELDLNNKDHYKLNNYTNYVNNDDNGWIDINTDELYTGKVISIALASYDISINKNSFPLKLKKSEFVDIVYKVFNNPGNILSLRKKFITGLEDANFYIFRLFQII